MTEVDVMNDMVCCENADCGNCSRLSEISGDCRRKLLRDARSVIKLQCDSLSGVSETIDKLKEENLALRNALKCNYEKKQLVAKMNDVIRAFGEDGYWDEECQESPLDMQVDALKKLLDLIGWDNYKIVIEKGCKYPQILK